MRLTVLIFGLVLGTVHSAKILGIFPFGARSHYILGNALMKGLAEKGHDVTIICAFPEKSKPQNGTYREIVLDGAAEAHEKMIATNPLEMDNVFIFVSGAFFSMLLDLTEAILRHAKVQEFLKNPDEQFDLVIVEQFNNDAHKAFAAHFNAPLVSFSTIGANDWVNFLTGNPAPPSYIPEIWFPFSSSMSFCERVINSVVNLHLYTMSHFYMYPNQGKLIEKYFPNPPKLDDVLYNASIVLLNSHPSSNQPVPYVPNMIDIGGYHIQPPKKLPKELQSFLDDAKDGVVYFSLGSNARSSLLPAEIRDILLRSFSRLKQKVLWKWESEEMEGRPDNVKLAKWLPQQDILAHPNIKLFITHGGLLSTLETIYHGIPVLAIPLGADQKLNAQRMVNQGFGLTLNWKGLTEEAFSNALNQLLDDPKYAQNVRTRSRLFHDRQVAPMDTAAYWVEYVLRHGGAPHLRVAGLDLPWYKYMLLDVIAFLAIIGLFATFVSYYVFKKFISLVCKRQKRKVKTH